MISRLGSATVDYFRRSAALYFSWDNGNRPGNYSHLRILNGDGRRGDLDDLASGTEIVGFNVINQSFLEQSKITTPQQSTLQAAYQTFLVAPINWGNNNGVLEDIFLGSWYVPVGAGSGWGENTVMKIRGHNGSWHSVSNYNGVSGALKKLFNEPYWSNWQAYVMGGNLLNDNDATEQEMAGGVIDRSGIPGIFGQETLAGSYLDHNTQINLMLPENISTSATYGYYSAFFDQLKNNPNVKETYIPNFYLVSSILHSLDNYSYPTLYNDYNETPDPVAPQGPSVNKVKQLLSDAIAPAHVDAVDILDPAVPVTLHNIQVSPQTPNTLLSRFARRDFTATESLATVENANKHIGLTAHMVKSLESAQTSIVSLMNVQDNIFPCSINVQFSSPSSGDSEPEMVQSLSQDGNDQSETFYNFVLYEVMKANILNYKNIDSGYSAIEQPTPGGMLPRDQLYEEIFFSAKIIDETDIRYRGIDWTGNGPWADESPGNTAREEYPLRTIDFTNMFKNIYQQQDSNFYGSGSNYNGFVGQTTDYNVVDGKGTIVGQRYKELSPPGGSWTQWTTTEFHAAGGIGGDSSVQAEFYTDLAAFTNEKMTSFYELLSHTNKFNEPLVFKLDKHEVLANGSVSPAPIQSIYIPKTGDVVKYKDTQVFAGKQYKYKIYSYNLVEGNSYSYNSPEVYPAIQEPYPSPLGRTLGFNTNQKILGVNVGPDWNALNQPNPVRNVYVGKLLAHALPSPTSWTLVDPDFWDHNANGYPYYIDVLPVEVDTNTVGIPVETPGTPVSARVGVSPQGVPFDGPVKTLGNPANQPGGLSKYVEDALNVLDLPGSSPGSSPWRVRFLTDADNPDHGRFVIAHRTALLNPSGPGLREALDWSQEFQDLAAVADFAAADDTFLPNNYLQLFGYGAMQTMMGQQGPPADQPIHKLMFETGQHGWNPTMPWVENEEQERGTAKVYVENRKSLKIIELEIGETNPVTVADLPPQFPNVDIYPIRGVNNKIKILLNESNHTDSYAPVVINVSDEQIFEDVRIAQGRAVGEGLVFGSDDSKLEFEIYRIETEPISYTDFSGHLRHNLNTVTPRGVSIESASTFDVIEPNTVYYYCFRTVDKNGYISNPSPILKVQMIDDNGRIYPIIEPFALEPVESRKTEKSFKRYLEIDASLQEKNIDLGTPPDLSSAGSLIFPPSVTLGDVIWDSETTFKVRIISKDTGRKMDLNIDFDIEAIPNPKLQGN